jgi:hypothetical protein
VTPKVVLTELQKKQLANFEAICAHARQDAQVFLSVVQQMFPEAGYTALREVSINHLKEARPFYLENPNYDPCPAKVPYPELNINYQEWAIVQFSDKKNTKSRKQREYQPWTLQRKQRNAVRRMLERFHKKWSLPEFWIPLVQEKILEDPWYYGCCPLPSEGSCIIPDPDRILARRKVMEKELALRAQEQS